MFFRKLQQVVKESNNDGEISQGNSNDSDNFKEEYYSRQRN